METYSLKFSEKISEQFFSAFEKVSNLAEKRVGVYAVTLGTLLIGITLVLRFFRIEAENFKILNLTQTDFIVLIIAGTLVFILGVGIKVYEYKTHNDRFMWQQGFIANSIKLQKEIGESTQNKIENATAKFSTIEPPISV